MLSPSKYLGLNGWAYGVANVPGRYSRRKIGFISSGDVVNIQETPKMHFHKSGEAAISLTGRRIERRNVKYQQMEKFRGEQFFSLSVDRPDLLPLSQPKAKDIMLFAHGSLPAAVGVCGFLCSKRRLKKLSADFFTVGNDIGFLPDGDTETIVIDLSPQGIDFYFSLLFKVFDSALPADAKNATSRLFSVDKRAQTFRTSKLLGLWNPDHVHPMIPMFTRDQSPFIKFRAAELPERDLKRILRGPDGVISESPWNENSG